MPTQPTLATERLLLRPLELGDAPTVQRLAGEREIAASTLLIPHPYQDGQAEMWIAGRQESFENGAECTFGVARDKDGDLVGTIGLKIDRAHERAELGYWIGKPFWNQGYATEAGRAVVCFAFERLEVNRVQAGCFQANAASARVLEKIGMTREGCLRQYYKKWGQFLDSIQYAILREEFDALLEEESA